MIQQPIQLRLSDGETFDIVISSDLDMQPILEAFERMRKDTEFLSKKKCWPLFGRLLRQHLSAACGKIDFQPHGEWARDILVLSPRYNTIPGVTIHGVIRLTFREESPWLLLEPKKGR